MCGRGARTTRIQGRLCGAAVSAAHLDEHYWGYRSQLLPDVATTVHAAMHAIIAACCASMIA